MPNWGAKSGYFNFGEEFVLLIFLGSKSISAVFDLMYILYLKMEEGRLADVADMASAKVGTFFFLVGSTGRSKLALWPEMLMHLGAQIKGMAWRMAWQMLLQ